MSLNVSTSNDQILYINGTGVSGVLDFGSSYSISRRSANILGAGFVDNVLAAPLEGRLSIKRDFLYDDPIISLTGEQACSGTILYQNYINGGEKVYGFNTGYLTSWSISCNVGDTPEISNDFTVFGQLGSGVRGGELDYSGNNLLPSLSPINLAGINLCFDGSGTNRAISFSQSYNIKRDPIYTIEQKTNLQKFPPNEVLTSYPIEIDTEIVIEVDDYDTANLIDAVRAKNFKTICIELNFPGSEGSSLDDDDGICIKDHNDECINDDGNETRNGYTFFSDKSQLISESIKNSVEGNLTCSLRFVDFWNKD